MGNYKNILKEILKLFQGFYVKFKQIQTHKLQLN